MIHRRKAELWEYTAYRKYKSISTLLLLCVTSTVNKPWHFTDHWTGRGELPSSRKKLLQKISFFFFLGNLFFFFFFGHLAAKTQPSAKDGPFLLPSEERCLKRRFAKVSFFLVTKDYLTKPYTTALFNAWFWLVGCCWNFSWFLSSFNSSSVSTSITSTQFTMIYI